MSDQEFDIKQLIVKYLRANGDTGAVTIATMIWQPVSKVITALQEMQKEGMVRKDIKTGWGLIRK